MANDTKEFSGCLGMEWKGEANGKDCKRAIGRLYVMDMFNILIVKIISMCKILSNGSY